MCLSLANDDKCKTINDKLSAFCGKSKHTASSENYFIDSTYRKIAEIAESQSLEMNTKGQITNVLPLVKARAKKSWLCDTLCKIDDPLLIDRYEKFLQEINACTFKKIPQLLQKIHICTRKQNSNTKLGHTHACYIDTTLCKAMSLSIQLLYPHFPKVRYIKRLIYQMTSFHEKMLNLEKALTSADLDTLNAIITVAQEKVNTYKHRQINTILSDEDIISRYSKAFKALTKRSMDTPRYACVSCERLCCKKDVSEINRLEKQMDSSPIWRDLMAHIKEHNINSEYICDYCERKFRDGILPAYCVLNNLFVHDVPDLITSLNTFEKILIQRAKAFQTVVKMGTVINKKLPERQMVQKVKGRTFHLPLPLQETWNKLCKKTDPINVNHEMYILVRGIPTKTSKIIWEEIVNVKKVFEALTWLKRNNPLYNHIILPDTHDGLCLDKLNNPEFEMQETENDNQSVSDDDHKLCANTEMQGVRNNVEAVAENERQAMLTQITDDSDSYYEQYTIYPLYEKKVCKTATALYQMLKIQDLPLDNREKALDLLCFPDLYPFGVNGQHDESRPMKLHDHEFIKCRLKSKHPQYRLNQQYLFYLLNNANIRQLRRGIYHRMNVTNLRDRYTASEYLEAMHKDLLESNLNTIFSNLRNTEQYWRRE